MKMVTALKSRQASVQFADPTAPTGVQVSTPAFLKECHQSALTRFRGRRARPTSCLTIEHSVPAKPGDQDSTGLIVAHVSQAVTLAWEADQPGSARQKRARVEAGIHLVLEDLADQDMHGYLAITDAQCAIYNPDLVQLLHEALDRTTFSHLGRQPDAHWEGTLVERVQPPYLILVVSIDFAAPASRKVLGDRPAPRARRPADS